MLVRAKRRAAFVAEEGVSETDAGAGAGADVAPAPAPDASSEMDAEEKAEFARFVDALAEAPGAFPEVREPETRVSRAAAEVEKRAAKKKKSRGQKTSPERIDSAESSSDYESFFDADGSPIDPFEAFEAHEEPYDPLAFTDAPSGYEALPPVAEKTIARDLPTRRERLAEWEKHFDDHYVDNLEPRRFDDDADFADAPEPSSDSSDPDADAEDEGGEGGESVASRRKREVAKKKL